MNCLSLLIITFLFILGFSLTFNLDDASSAGESTVLIFRKNRPSILIFPNKETITLKYPKQNRLTKLKLGGNQPMISFKNFNMMSQKEIKQQELKPNNKEIIENPINIDKDFPKEKELPKEKQIQKKVPKPVENKHPVLSGNYELANPAQFNLQRSIIININDKYISYTMCSKNTCEFKQQKGQIEVGSCTMISRPTCQPFTNLFYSDLRLLAQLELIDQFSYENGIYKFYDKLHAIEMICVKFEIKMISTSIEQTKTEHFHFIKKRNIMVLFAIFDQDYYIMVWIFVQCSEYQGQCIRSYIALGVAVIVCLFSLAACLMHYRQKRLITFQQLPLTINFVTSLSLVVIYSQKQMFNIRLILLLIEFYSYFLLSFGFIFNVLRKSIKAIRFQTFQDQSKKAWLIFGLVTATVGILIALLIVLAASNTVNCLFDQQVGSIIVLALQIPLTIVTFILISKAKIVLASVFHNTSQRITGSNVENTQFSQMTQHLLKGDDQNKRLNYRQTDLVRFGLVFSVILHISELTCVVINNYEDQILCNPNNNRIEVMGPLGLATVSIETVSELFPHIIIPIIFWFLVIQPRLATETLYLTKSSDPHGRSKYKNPNESNFSNFQNQVRSEENIRQKMFKGRLPSNEDT